ncbi:MAG: hypothetical protein WAV28_00180 [Sedimentisphaerales bacterium]
MRKQNSIHNHIVLVIAIAVLASAGPAFGQFLVQPMKMELAVRPGKIFKTTLDLQSLDPNESHSINMSIVELMQYDNGEWQIIEPNSLDDPNSPNFGFDISTLSSCSQWIGFRPASVEIKPFTAQSVDVYLRVPAGVRGFYSAGIIAGTKPRPDATGIPLVLRFLIPVLVEVQGRPIRHRIELKEDIGMKLVEAVGGRPATTVVSMGISNKGGTYSSLKAFAKIRGFWDGHWREVTEAEFPQVSIIPGAEFKLNKNIGRSLPSGKYRLSGVLYVDGRRADRIEKEINFVGDTSIKKVAVDTPLDLRPSEVLINCRPGATRTAAVTVRNASDETVNVQMGLALPGNLQGVAFGDLKGDDLDCTGWLKIDPEKFTLRSMTQQSVRITATMPKSAAIHPCYYALLGMFSTYPDGQRGGVTTAYICVADESISSEPFVYGMKLSPALKGGSQYYIVARFGNFGRIHFTPIRCRAQVVTETGEPRAFAALSSSKSDTMLPLEVRDFSGIVDFSNFSAGLYRLEAALEYAPGEVATKQIGIRVLPQGEQRIVEVVKLEEELGEKIKVQW